MKYSWGTLLLILSMHYCHAAITGLVVVLHDATAGATTLADVSMTITTAIPVGGKISVVFPTGFSIAPTTLSAPVGISSSCALSSAGNNLVVTIATSSVAVGTISFTVDGIKNLGATTTGTFTVNTYDATALVIETGTSLTGLTIALGSALTASVVLANNTASVTGGCSISITTSLLLPVGGKFAITFPSRFGVASTHLTSITDFIPTATTTVMTVTGNTVYVTIGAFPLPPGTYSFKVDGITNPGSSCNQFYNEICSTTWEGYIVSTLDIYSNPYQTVTTPGTAIIKSNLYFGRVTPLLKTPNTVTSATIVFNTVLPIPVGGYVVVVFPSSFGLSAVGVISGWSGLNAASTFTITGTTLSIQSATIVPATKGIQFTLSGVTTPPVNTVGYYSIYTKDSGLNTIEEATNIGGVGCYFMNQCNGHGTCTMMSEKCICQPGWGAPSDISIGGAPDCSLRTICTSCYVNCGVGTCPAGLAWADIPISQSSAHNQLMECSGQGYCNRQTGECQCFPEFTGIACDRLTCPNDCSGHGLCLNMQQLALRTDVAPLSPATTYSSWDATRIYGCKCDSSWPVGLGAGQTRVSEWFGADCSLRHCPSGDDPITAVDETNCAGVASASGVGVGAAGNLCFNECSGRGVCYYHTGECRCFNGFKGAACNEIDILFIDRNRTLLDLVLAGW